MAKIADFLPKDITPRLQQSGAFAHLEDNWDKCKVHLIEAPTATGKSIIAYGAAQYAAQEMMTPAAITIHRKNLQDQYQKEFPHIPLLKGMGSYSCFNHNDKTCRDAKKSYKRICTQDKQPCCNWYFEMLKAKEAPVSIYNLHSYYHNGQFKKVLVADEAHSLLTFLTDMSRANIQFTEAQYPNDVEDPKVAIRWLESVIKHLNNQISPPSPEDEQEDDYLTGNRINLTGDEEEIEEMISKFSYIQNRLTYNPDNYIIQKVENHKDKYVCFAPKTLRDAGRMLWPEEYVDKIILLSATFNDIDLRNLGFSEDEVSIYRCGSPIPPPQRPFRFINACNMSNKYKDGTFPSLVEAIKTICNKHAKESGIIHTTYELATKLEREFPGSRFIYHRPSNAQYKLQEFLTGPRGKILVACGMSEGLDLKGDLAGFQIITKAMYPHLGDPLWAWKLKNAKIEYIWETIRTIIQQTGRVSRFPEDFGITYFVDGNGSQLFTPEYSYLWPKWFLDSAKVTTLEKIKLSK